MVTPAHKTQDIFQLHSWGRFNDVIYDRKASALCELLASLFHQNAIDGVTSRIRDPCKADGYARAFCGITNAQAVLEHSSEVQSKVYAVRLLL